jgi:hypothetical protein
LGFFLVPALTSPHYTEGKTRWSVDIARVETRQETPLYARQRDS